MRKTLLGGLAAVAFDGLAYAQMVAYAQTASGGPAVPLPSDTIIAARQAGYDLQAGIAAGMKTVINAGGNGLGPGRPDRQMVPTEPAAPIPTERALARAGRS